MFYPYNGNSFTSSPGFYLGNQFPYYIYNSGPNIYVFNQYNFFDQYGHRIDDPRKPKPLIACLLTSPL